MRARKEKLPWEGVENGKFLSKIFCLGRYCALYMGMGRTSLTGPRYTNRACNPERHVP